MMLMGFLNIASQLSPIKLQTSSSPYLHMEREHDQSKMASMRYAQMLMNMEKLLLQKINQQLQSNQNHKCISIYVAKVTIKHMPGVYLLFIA